MRFDIKPQAVVGLVNDSQNALLQIVKEGCLMNDVRYSTEVIISKAMVFDFPVFSVRPIRLGT